MVKVPPLISWPQCFQASGHKVGLFSSPHLTDVRERIKVDNRWISETDFADCISEVKELSEQLLQKGIITNTPTYFEYTFLAALYHFYPGESNYRYPGSRFGRPFGRHVHHNPHFIVDNRYFP